MLIRCPALSLRLIAFVLRSARDRGASACRDVTGTVSFRSPIRNYVDALVPVAVQQDALTAARYRAFILPRLAREEGIELRLRLAQNLPEIGADKRAFSQILINLISNAVKFTPRGGCVTIGASCDWPRLVITVEDTGVGIEQDDLARLGEAFFQARSCRDRRPDGSGLGLSIVKGLVKLHDGQIDIRSRVGEGTRVTVRLPIAQSGDRMPLEPVKLVAESHRDNPYVSTDWVKKSA